ncbi:MAG: cupin domain-containing protein [Thermoplasmatota archaeon]
MKHIHYSNVGLETLKETGIKDVKIRWLISEKDGANNFAMRLFEIQPNGYTPLHQHDWEHEVFIVEGNGVANDNTKEIPFRQGDVFFIPSLQWHQFKNTGNTTLKVLCLIPYKKV